MNSLARFLLAAGSAAALFGVASADPVGGAKAILFDQPNFQGHSLTIVEGSPDLGRWNAAAQAASGRFEGGWTVCDAPDLDGKCATVAGDVADLGKTGLARIVSLGEAPATAADDGGLAMTTAGPQPAPPAASEVTASAPATPAAPAARSPAVGRKRHAAAVKLASASPAKAGAVKLAAASAAPPTATAAGMGAAGQAAVFFAKPVRDGAAVAVDAQGPADQFCREQGLGPAVYFDVDGAALRDVLCRRS